MSLLTKFYLSENVQKLLDKSEVKKRWEFSEARPWTDEWTDKSISIVAPSSFVED